MSGVSPAGPADSGIEALALLLRLQGVAADAGEIRHRLGTNRIGAAEMLRCARQLGLKARTVRTHWARLAATPLPAIASLHDGGYLVVSKAADDKVLVQLPLAPRPVLMTQAEFVAMWDGNLILMTRRAGLSDITRRFDITWVLGAAAEFLVEPPAKERRRGCRDRDVKRERAQHDAGQEGRVDEHHGQEDCGKQEVDHQGERRAGEKIADVLQLAHPRDRIADAPRLEIGERQRQQMAKQPRAELDVYPVGGVREEVSAKDAKNRLKQRDRQ